MSKAEREKPVKPEVRRKAFTRPEIREHGEIGAITGYFGLFIAT